MKEVGIITDDEYLDSMKKEKESGYLSISFGDRRLKGCLNQLTGKSFRMFLDKAYPRGL